MHRPALFGFRSGISTAIFLFAQAIFIIVAILLKNSILIIPIIGFTIIAKILGDYVFFTLFSNSMDSFRELKNWKSIISKRSFFDAHVFIIMVFIIVDFFTDAFLVYGALQIVTSKELIFILLLTTQAICGPIQGVISDVYSQKNSILFAFGIAVIAVFILLSNMEGAPFLELSILSLETQIFLAIGIKGVFGNIGTIARGALARNIKLETMKVFD
ncbi:MAG: hypothetical protein P0S95_05875 [Rhabdochlamydiaceae bacterium]|nr:hypothetical protein [Candidatus Amphrikana amoebophyrae]